ncbi:MAG: phosphoribosylanthranilate isomerase [Deltaproteobacteria bacterium]|jgi:phosphoribosylanthranilate isomerase|nr:phosphoribosylanthranilate isomerase [Deltaproteobacteria bacterium]
MTQFSFLTQAAPPFIKICGLTNAQDALSCAQLGADGVGFIFHPPSPRFVEPTLVRDFLTPSSLRVGVFVGQGAREILAIMATARLDLAQLHGDQALSVARAIGAERVIRVFWPERYKDAPEAWAAELDLWSAEAAAFLFDAGSGGGGHGRKVGVPFSSPQPYLLAGGLQPSDLGQLWPADDPGLAGFDFNSGVEKSPGVKDLAAIGRLLGATKSN